MNNRVVQIMLILLTIALLVLVSFNAPVWLLLLLLLILLLLLLWWLFGGSSDDKPDGERPFPDPNHPPEEYFIENQVVVRGPLSAVNRAINSVGDSIQLRRVNRIAFSDLDEATLSCFGRCSDVDFTNFVIDLYELDGSYEDVADAIRAINQTVGKGSDVRAEPNLLSGYPWDPFGSPWDPFGSGMEENRQAPPDYFMDQWAFTEIGLPTEAGRSGGRGVRIGLFDTSPYDNNEAAPQSPIWINEPNQLTIELAHYPTPTPKPDDPDLSSHGLFGAGLAHAVAPDATIQLIRVLGSHNKGDLFSLNLAIFEFILANAPSQRQDGTIGAVINLSLGIRVPPDHAGFDFPVELQSLRDLLRAAQCAQIVVVAAAGNNSANLPQPEPANLPANWPEIMGVASSTKTQDRSCFSNQGDLAAPGGNGRSDKDEDCIPANNECDAPDCPYAVIGPVQKTDDNTGFAYWSGTSFAAPMVTGLAALVIEKGNGKLSPQEVRRIIECGATLVTQPDLGNRIIHVANTVTQFEACAKKNEINLDSPDQKAT